MNARSFYVTVRHDELVDRRGARRAIKVMTGMNKGKKYPYAGAKRGGARAN